MSEIISLKNIKVHQYADDWQQAIDVAGKTLVQCGSIKEEYINKMIDAVKDLGPYMVIMEHFALAHAAPGPEVLEDDLSISVFDNDIRFGSDNDPVRVVMCLASTDGESHISKLSVIASKLLESDGQLVEDIINAEDEQKIYDLLNN